jgi:hypothetical protein
VGLLEAARVVWGFRPHYGELVAQYLYFEGDGGHGDADAFIKAQEALLALGDEVLDILLREWHRPGQVSYRRASVGMLLAKTSYRGRLLEGLQSALTLGDSESRSFAAELLARVCVIGDHQLNPALVGAVVRENIQIMKTGRGDVNWKWLESFAGVGRVDYTGGAGWPCEPNGLSDARIRFWEKWGESSDTTR